MECCGTSLIFAFAFTKVAMEKKVHSSKSHPPLSLSLGRMLILSSLGIIRVTFSTDRSAPVYT